jgi:uncharacterized protein
LKHLYEKIIIPHAVYRELTGPPMSAGGQESISYDWIHVRNVSNRSVVDEFLKFLDLGESEVIALALEVNADQVLLDERAAREFAESQGLNLTGVLGVLIAAKSRGLIAEIRPFVDILKNQVDFWLSEALCQRVLEAADEDSL